jgi:thiol-disulfide isomerase/thioredoxin
MSFFRTFFDRLFSQTFLAGLLCGAVLGAGGLKLFAMAYMQMGGGGDAPEQARYLEPIELSDSTATTIRGIAPRDWTVRPLDGTGARSFGSLRERPTLLTVGATWCEPCTAELSTLQALHDTTGRDVRVAFVSSEPRDSLRRHVDENDYSLPVYTVDDVPPVFEGDALPRTYLIRAGGEVVYRHVGPADWSTGAARLLLNRARSARMAHRSPAPSRYLTAQRRDP